MIIGVPKEIKPQEKRVGLTPESVETLVGDGHEVIVESGAGTGIGASDSFYRDAGASIVGEAAGVFERAKMIVKVKEPQASEIAMLGKQHLLYTYLHLAPDRAQTEGLMRSGCTAIAYETITDSAGTLPLLTPMSQVAGRMATHVAANCLHHTAGGLGLLMGGVPGVQPAKVMVLGGGVSGLNAAQMAMGLGAEVCVFDINLNTLARIQQTYGNAIKTQYSNPAALRTALREADVVIGAVLIQGAKAPHLVTREDLKNMKPGAVMVDIAIDQGGCFETSRPTTHSDPVFKVDGIVHYCVANMPGAVPRTSSYALNAATLGYARKLATKDVAAMDNDIHLRNGLNIMGGKIVHPAITEAFPDLA